MFEYIFLAIIFLVCFGDSLHSQYVLKCVREIADRKEKEFNELFE